MAREGFLFARLALDYADHPKIAVLSDAAFRLHITLILYARRFETDGVIKKRVGYQLANQVGFESDSDLLGELLHNDDEAPSLSQNDNGDFVLYGFEEMQETRDEIAARRRRNSANGAKGGRPKTHSKTHSVTDSKTHSVSGSGTQKKAETETETEIKREPIGSLAQVEDLSTRAPAAKALDFEAFWAAYPRKVGKDKARTKYRAAVKRAGSEEPILDGVRRFATDPNLPESKQYIPHAATWLEQGRWEDEPLPPRAESWSARAANGGGHLHGTRTEDWLPSRAPAADVIDADVFEVREIGR